MRVPRTADVGERGTAKAGNEKVPGSEVALARRPEKTRPDQDGTGQAREDKKGAVPVGRCYSTVVQYASAGATATAGDIPSWFLHRPCPNEIREDLTPANQCSPPAAETRMRSHCTFPVCHTEHPRRLTGSGPLNLTVLRREANRSLFPVASCSAGGNVYVAVDSNLRSKATVAGDSPERSQQQKLTLLCKFAFCNFSCETDYQVWWWQLTFTPENLASLQLLDAEIEAQSSCAR